MKYKISTTTTIFSRDCTIAFVCHKVDWQSTWFHLYWMYVTWVDFTNIFLEAFNSLRSQKHKQTDSVSVFFAGSASLKAFRKMLVKSTHNAIRVGIHKTSYANS